MQKTGIEYLTHTWNPIAMRCTPCSPGCANCWHLRTADRLKNNPGLPDDERKALAGEGPFIIRERELSAPLRTKKPAVIGVQFMGDLFHEDVPDSFIGKTWDTMASCPQHTFLVLTKRPDNMVWMHQHMRLMCLDNVWHGATICNQPEADAKITDLLKVPGKHFLSIEPMLGAIDSLPLCTKNCSAGFPENTIGPCDKCTEGKIDLVILGGETGHGSRPLHPDWVRSVRDQCIAAGVPFFFKQWGEWTEKCLPIVDKQHPRHKGLWLSKSGGYSRMFGHDPTSDDAVWMEPVGSKRAGRLLDGREWNELPWRAQG